MGKSIKLKSSLFRFIVTIISITITFFILELLETPYVFAGLIWVITILFLSLGSKKNYIKIIGINLSAIIFAFTIFEGYLWLKNGEYYLKTITLPENCNRVDDVLGYAPRRGEKINETEFFGDKLIYKATYTIGEDGLRITPMCNDSSTEGCVLFFGGSFTYGLGLNDNETMPYQVGIKAKGKYCTYNFGYGGYGPHQMLSELEQNIVKNIVHNKGKIYAIYLAVPDHIRRAAGLSWWDEHGPKYILGNNGEVKFAGNFDDEMTLSNAIIKYRNKSLIYRDMIFKSLFYKDLIVSKIFFNYDKEIELFLGIICTAKKDFEKIYPDGEFHVILWDLPLRSDLLSTVKSYFKVNKMNLHLLSKILPDYMNNNSKYILSPHDYHPNALTCELIANYIANNILKE